MPRYDGTGPFGQGPMTGRGTGACKGMAQRRCGRGRGMGPMVPALNLSKEEKRKILEAELGQLESEKKQVEQQLKKMG